EAKAHSREHTMGSARINRARRPVLVPPAVDYHEELVPIVFVPHGLFPLPRDSRHLLHVMRQTLGWSLPKAQINSGCTYTPVNEVRPAVTGQCFKHVTGSIRREGLSDSTAGQQKYLRAGVGGR